MAGCVEIAAEFSAAESDLLAPRGLFTYYAIIYLDCAENANMAKTCPITTVQDSIDALALSLFEALRGIRDATVASSSSTSTATKTGADPTSSAYREEEEEEDEQRQLVLRQQISSLLEKHNASEDYGSTAGDSCSSGNDIDNEATRLATIRLLHGLNVNYFPPRAYDMNNPDYESFLIAYLSEDKYAQELVEMMQHSSTTISSNTTTKQDEEVSSSSSSSNNTIIKLTSTATATTDWDNDNGNNMTNSSAATTTKKSKSSIKLNVVSSKRQQLLPKHIIESTSTGGGGSSSSNSSGGGGNVIFPRNHEEYVRLLHSARHDRDECTARRLARNVLSKSRTIDALVSNLRGMERNRTDQLRKIGELIVLNHELSHELEEAYTLANARREEVRRTLRENTCLALGIDEEEE